MKNVFLNEKTIWLEKNKNLISGTTVRNSPYHRPVPATGIATPTAVCPTQLGGTDMVFRGMDRRQVYICVHTNREGRQWVSDGGVGERIPNRVAVTSPRSGQLPPIPRGCRLYSPALIRFYTQITPMHPMQSLFPRYRSANVTLQRWGGLPAAIL